MSATPVVLCRLAELEDPGSRGFSVRLDGRRLDLFVVRIGARAYAYRNSCPHTGAPLDWVEHRFLDLESRWIQCATHDALFEMATGLCVHGPCAGQRLQGLPLCLVDGKVLLTGSG